MSRAKNAPFLLTPAAKDYLWGGSRLNDDFNFKIDIDPFAEAWVCSTHPDGTSLSKDTGVPLTDLLASHPEYLGTHPLIATGGIPALPIMIKLIDAKSDLSVQVHPSDAYAMQYEHGSLGKTEMWYVLVAKPGASLVYGFKRDVTAEEVRAAIEEGTVQKLLNRVAIHKNDLFYIESGTVHAIGAGALIAEIQESSNITYRLYDYERTGKDGKKRPLHIDRAMEVAKLSSSLTPRQPMRVLKHRRGIASELLCRCRYFQVERILLNTEVVRELVDYKTGTNSFHALLCVDGCGSVTWGLDRKEAGNDRIIGGFNFFKGDCVFIPAESPDLKLHGRAQLLDVSC